MDEDIFNLGGPDGNHYYWYDLPQEYLQVVLIAVSLWFGELSHMLEYAFYKELMAKRTRTVIKGCYMEV